MGNLDRWSTPKQIKIERAGDPRPLRRGSLKKGERKKGQKARIDELLASKKVLWQYAEYILSERKRRIEHPEWYRSRKDGLTAYDPHWEDSFDYYRKRHIKLLAAALKDGIIADVHEWIVEKP